MDDGFDWSLPKLTLKELQDAIRSYNGVATLLEICEALKVSSAHSERVQSRLSGSKHFIKVPIEQLNRPYKTKNLGSIKWAYKIANV